MLVVSGCGLFGVGEDREQRLGVLLPDDEVATSPVQVSADTVRAGRILTVTVLTTGNGCYAKGPTEVRVDGLAATVTPYDYFDLRAEACADVLQEFRHRAEITFEEAGAATVRIRAQPEVTRTIVVE
jgi:hypothetical protein